MMKSLSAQHRQGFAKRHGRISCLWLPHAPCLYLSACMSFACFEAPRRTKQSGRTFRTRGCMRRYEQTGKPRAENENRANAASHLWLFLCFLTWLLPVVSPPPTHQPTSGLGQQAGAVQTPGLVDENVGQGDLIFLRLCEGASGCQQKPTLHAMASLWLGFRALSMCHPQAFWPPSPGRMPSSDGEANGQLQLWPQL